MASFQIVKNNIRNRLWFKMFKEFLLLQVFRCYYFFTNFVENRLFPSKIVTK
jgi:hypothetical protein